MALLTTNKLGERRCAALKREGAGWELTYACFLMLCFWIAGVCSAVAETAPPPEYRLKAVFLLNFAQFVEWPADTFPDEKAPLVIGILGADPFGDFLDETVKGESIHGHPIAIKRFHTIDEAENSHILFISDSEVANFERHLSHLARKPILTVGDADQFALHGGMIRFFTENRKIRFRINIKSVQDSHLTLSSKLLRVAEIVGNKKE